MDRQNPERNLKAKESHSAGGENREEEIPPSPEEKDRPGLGNTLGPGAGRYFRSRPDLQHVPQPGEIHGPPRQRPGTQEERECDGYSIVVQAVVEHRDGKATRAEFVETEGPRLPHLPDPNLGRILDRLPSPEFKERYIIENPDGSIGINESPFPFDTETVELLHQQSMDKKNKWILQWLLLGNDCGRNEQEYESREEIYLKEQRERISRQLQEQTSKP